MKNLAAIYTDNDAISLLIRHSERYDHSDMKDLRLTEQGISKAVELGGRLSNYKINRIITTKVSRCTETAECIEKGYGRNIEIKSSKDFGRLYYTDRDTAKAFLEKQGYKSHELYKRMISEIDTPGISSIESYKKSMDDFIIDNTNNNGITIFVSHDMNIAYYQFCINKTKYERFTDVKYLCGMLLCNGKYVSDFQAEV